MGFSLKKLTKAVSNVGKAVARPLQKLTTAPIDITKQVVSGDLKGAGKTVIASGGAGVQAMSQGILTVASTPESQRILKEKSVTKYTGGFSKDVAGSASGSVHTMETGEVKKEFLENYGRMSIKAIGAAYAYGAAPSAFTAQNAAPAIGAIGAFQKGDVVGGIGAVGGIKGLPEIDTPKWVQDGRSLASAASQYLPSGSQPAQSSGSSYGSDPQYLAPQVEGAAQPPILMAGLGLIAVLVLFSAKKRG